MDAALEQLGAPRFTDLGANWIAVNNRLVVAIDELAGRLDEDSATAIPSSQKMMQLKRIAARCVPIPAGDRRLIGASPWRMAGGFRRRQRQKLLLLSRQHRGTW